MQIQLKQTEIISALKQFITAQGINLAGKDVSISFTAGRKEAGIIADVTIDDVSIPGYTDSEVEEAIKATDAPVLSVVKAAIATEATVHPMAEAAADLEATCEPEPSDAVQAAPAKTTSLFGNN